MLTTRPFCSSAKRWTSWLENSPRQRTLVKLRLFAGLTLDEAGQVLGFTERTAKRHWAFARAWLYHAIKAALKS